MTTRFHPIVASTADAAHSLRLHLDEFDRAAEADELEPDQLAYLAALAKVCVAAARSIEDQARHLLGARMGGTSAQYGPIVAARSYDTNRVGWDHEGLLHATLVALEVPDEVRSRLLDSFPAGSFSWRVGKGDKRRPDVDPPGLRDIGLDPDEWCETQRRGAVATLTFEPERVIDDVVKAGAEEAMQVLEELNAR